MVRFRSDRPFEGLRAAHECARFALVEDPSVAEEREEGFVGIRLVLGEELTEDVSMETKGRPVSGSTPVWANARISPISCDIEDEMRLDTLFDSTE